MSLLIQKGNFYNHITGKIDHHILDSDEYYLKLSTEIKTSFYRIRFLNSSFEAFEISKPENFHISPYPKQPSISQLYSFRTTDYYQKEFQYKNLFEIISSKEKSQSHKNDYYEYLVKISGKEVLTSEFIYDFVIPCTHSIHGVKAYQISIELVRKRYYIIFIKEFVEKGYHQHEKVLYCIYDKKFISQKKKEMEDAILTLCLENDYPITLTTFLLTICHENITLLKKIMSIIQLARTKKEKNILLINQLYPILSPSLQYDNNLQREIEKYIFQEEEDISYEFKKREILDNF